jgi:hypothetical protein
MKLPIVERLTGPTQRYEHVLEAAKIITALAKALEPQFSKNMLGDILFGKFDDTELINLTMPVGHYRAICAALALAKGEGK